MVKKRKLVLSEEAEKIEEETIPELLELNEEVIEEAKENCDSWAEADAYTQKNDQLEDQVKYYRALAERFREWDDEDPGARFVINELSADDNAAITDRVREESFEMDARSQQYEGVPKEAAAKVLSVKHSLIEVPEVEETEDVHGDDGEFYPGHLPDAVLQYLYDEVDDLNTDPYDVDLEDFSSVKEGFEKASDS